jgi:excisionase family DNA binding protein
MPTGRGYGTGTRMLTLGELCEWLNITERHVRKLVERDAIPYRKVGHLLRFPEAEIEGWSHPPQRTRDRSGFPEPPRHAVPAPRRPLGRVVLPKSLIDLLMPPISMLATGVSYGRTGE